MIKWLKNLSRAIGLHTRVTALDLKCIRLQAQKRKSDDALDEKLAKLELLEKELTAQLAITRATIHSAKLLNERHEEALAAARAELYTANKITIPGLVANFQVLINAAEQRAAIEAGKTAMVTSDRGD